MFLRGMFEKIFGRPNNPQGGTQFKMLSSYEDFFTPAPKYNYSDITVRAVIHTIATNAAKFKIKHIKRDMDGKVTNQHSKLQRLFDTRINEYMSSYDFLYKVISQLYTDNNVFIKIKTDNLGNIVGLYPLSYINMEMREYDNELYLKFYFETKQETIPYRDLIHLRRFYNGHDILGEQDSSGLSQQLGILNSLKQALESVVKNCTKLRGIIKVNGILRQQDKANMLDEFNQKLTSTTYNNAILDNSAEYQQLNSTLETAEEEQMTFVQGEIYKYFGINENIVKAQYTSSEWQSFYQNVLQPLAVQLSQEFTAKIFTQQELNYGHEIIFTSDRLQYASLQEKVSLIGQCQQVGIMTINEARELLGYDPVDDGDSRLVSLNYIKAEDQSSYQVGKEGENIGIQNDGNSTNAQAGQ